jgi:hypothetical protein
VTKDDNSAKNAPKRLLGQLAPHTFHQARQALAGSMKN